MRLLWYSNAPFSATGYGNQTKLFVPRLKRLGHEMAILAFYGLEGGILNWDGVRVYPRGYHMYGNDVYSAHAKHFEADLIISLIDIWVLDPSAQGNPHGIPIAAWFPVDSDPMSPAVMDKAKQVFAPIVFSKFGVRMAEEAGLPHFYVPHGVDTKIFMPGDKAEARRKSLLPEDAFVVTMVAANKGAPSRKAFQQQLEAFAMLRRKHKDALLYLHTTKAENGENGGVNLVELCTYLGLDTGKSGSVVFADQYTNLVGFPEPYMVNVYQFSDVVMNVSMGEGFGIPILEAQACGTPVIVGDWTSMPELCFGGWKVSRADCTPFWTPLATYQFVPHTGAIYDLMERAYGASAEKRLQLSRRARAGALEYDADTVTERYWKPLLEMLNGRLKANGTSRGLDRGADRPERVEVASGERGPNGDLVPAGAVGQVGEL
jgi:glycosyltransferase involved in cell wall biosynthesis